MEIENNVEQAVVTPAAIGGDKEETASYGKFKSSDELLNAYNALEAEFTRRSQRIKELEGKLESGRIAEEWTNRLNELHDKYPVSRKLTKELGEYIKANETLIGDKDCLEKALLNVLATRSEFSPTPERAIGAKYPGGEPQNRAEVPEKTETVRVNPPKIPVAYGNMPANPFRRPLTVAEAGLLAQEHFKKMKGE